jgi:SpoVK/Ycf46/Vps4 family AAA+-type ATPase
MGNKESKKRKNEEVTSIHEKPESLSERFHEKNYHNNNNKISENPNNPSNGPNPNTISNPNSENIQNTPNENPLMQYLNHSYKLFTEGNNLVKQFSFYEALFKYEEAEKLTMVIYPKISDEALKNKVDHYIKSLKSQIDFANFQIKNQFEYKEKAGFASRHQAYERNACILESIKILNKENNKEKTKEHEKDKVSQSKTNTDSESKTKENPNKIVSNDLIDKILSEIVDTKPGVKFSDVIGLDQAKQNLKEIIILPNLRPDLFTGLRTPPRGLLLFGPPGVGKTMIAKAVATECECTFFNISASSLTSKYLGESEKLVRALFDLAYQKQPSVVFIDEIESILSKRSDNENEASKRLKTEFLVQFDGVGSNQEAKVLIIGATNRPQELDTAVLRRLPKRIYICPFNEKERIDFIISLMKNTEHTITYEEFQFIAKMTNNYSNSDLKELCREAAYESIREISEIASLNVDKLRPANYSDFLKAIRKVRGSLSENILNELEKWNSQYGALN